MPVDVKTDHDSLKYMNTQSNLTGRLERWFQTVTLGEYNLKITHIQGKDNVVADTLSSSPDHAQPSPQQCLWLGLCPPDQ